MKLKNRYNNFRYIFRRKYPALFNTINTIAFPAKVLLLCLSLAALVSYYQKHYSFGAASNTSRTIAATGNATQLIAAQPEDTSLSPVVFTEGAEAEQTMTELAPEPETLLPYAEFRKLTTTILSVNWLLAQPSNYYVAQIASSPNLELLTSLAQNQNLEDPLAIYPFKVNKNGNLVYGLSSGLFTSKSPAMAKVPELAEISEHHGVWVRQISEIGDQLESLKKKQSL